jgi:tellurite resistance protein
VCGAPATMKVKAKVTVKMGRAVAVIVKTDPPDATITACVEKAIRDLAWDRSVRSGTVTVTY